MGVNIQTIKEIRSYLESELGQLYPEQELKAIVNIIIKTVTGLTKLHQLYNADQKITKEIAEKVIEAAGELRTGKPVQYVLGETVFYNCLIKLNSSTLIPRPETEELVDLILKENKGYKGDIIDFGTGSGCIAIALAANLSEAHVTGIDISEESLKVARENALLNKVKVSFKYGDIFNFDLKKTSKTGIIVSNPPYVRESEKQLMSKNVLDFEPHSALFVSDADPLVYYKSILNIAGDLLYQGGRIYFEINEAFGNPAEELLSSYGYSAVKIVNDINNRNRFIEGIKNV